MSLPPWSGRLLHGFVAGILLAALHAPLGLDWTQTAVLQGTSAALFRAAGLFLLALGFDARRRGFREGPGAGWLASVAAGFALQLFWIDRVPASRAGFALLCVCGVLALRALAGKRHAEAVPVALARRERVALLLAGAGAALALESLAHEVRLFTTGNAADDGLVALVFLGLVFAGGLAFGPLLARVRAATAGFLFALALAAGLAVVGLLFLARLTPLGLPAYLEHFDGLFEYGRRLDRVVGADLGFEHLPALDIASIGTLWTTVLLGAAAFALPAFALGAALAGNREPARPAYGLMGAGLGLLASPHLVQFVGEPLRDGSAPAVSWTLVATGAALAAGGLLIAAFGTTRRVAWIAAALGSAALPWLRPHLAFANLSPWSARQIEAELLWPTPEGLLCVEPGRGGIPLLTLDRRRLTPDIDELAGDALALRSSFELLAPETRKGRVRTLFIGQLTPARARVLGTLGDLALERTAPWHRAMPILEQHLFAGEEPPIGTILPPSAARARLAAGEYDWVVACGIRGPILCWKSEARELWGGVDAPRFCALELPAGTLGVAWVPADSSVGRGVTLGPLLMAFDGLERPCFGLVRGAHGKGPLPLFELDSWNGPSVRGNLARLPQLRAFELERAWAEGLRADGHASLARGLARHFAAQTLSSPYETRAQQVELDEEALRAFFEAVPPAGELDLLSATLWEALARLFFEKRQPEYALVYLEPVAQRFAPWPALERCLVRAYREVLEPEVALAYAERVFGAYPDDFELLIEASQAAREAGTPERGQPFLERAVALQPSHLDQIRALGLELVEAGDERGRGLLEAVRRENPEDEEVLRALSEGPWQR
jgi:hypothetical protein